MLSILFVVIAYLLYILTTVCLFAANYLIDTLQVTSFSQILYNMEFGMEGSSSDVWNGVFASYWQQFGAADLIIAFLGICIIAMLLFIRLDPNRKHNVRSVFKNYLILSLVLCVTSGFCLADSAYIALNKVGYFSYLEKMDTDSNFYETYYVQPDSAMISAPENPRNAIIIWVESMETSLLSTQAGGTKETSVMPNMERLAMNYSTTFSDPGSVTGARQVSNTSWTIAGIMASSAGIPLAYTSKQSNQLWKDSITYLPGAVSIGDLLEDQGYRNMFRLGSKASYAGRANYFTQHGDFEIRDYEYSVANGEIPEDYFLFWGYEDEKLFEFAKKDLTELADSDEPFCYTMLTVNTHFPEGLVMEGKEKPFDIAMYNAFWNEDKMLWDFIYWMTLQPWYKDTTILITGDHLSMDEELAQDTPYSKRRVLNLMLNAPAYNGGARQYSTMDLFPTFLSALGFTIEGDRLGLGVNLYSDEPTIIEELGYVTVNDEIEQNSDFYNQVIMGLPEEEEDVHMSGLIGIPLK